MADKRKRDASGNPIDFTCANRNYETNEQKGHSHGTYGAARGSVFSDCILASGSYTLWLEHVTEKATGEDFFWLMWYDGVVPAIPLSGVFKKDDLGEIARRLSEFIP